MSKTIWKFQLLVIGIQSIEMPENAEILCIQIQNEDPYIWALVEPENATIKRTFETYGTAQPIKEISHRKRNFIGTYQIETNQIETNQLVFHCFELL